MFTELRFFGLAFLATNLAFGPIAALLAFKSELAAGFLVASSGMGLIYGLYFVLGGLAGRFILPHLPHFTFKSRFLFGTVALCAGLLICQLRSGSIAYFTVVFVGIVGLLGGVWFLAPLANHVTQRTTTRPATAVAVATVGQLTTTGFWKTLYSAGGVQHWPAAFTLTALIIGITLPFLIVMLDSRYVPFANAATPVDRPAARLNLSRLASLGYGFVALAGTILIVELGSMDLDVQPRWRWGYEYFSATAILGRLGAATLFDRGMREQTILATSAVLAMSALLLCGRGFHPAVYVTGCLLLGGVTGVFLPVALIFFGMPPLIEFGPRQPCSTRAALVSESV